MSSASLYNQIYTDNHHRISTGSIEVDPWLADRSADRRLGISLIIPIQEIRSEYEALVSRFQSVAPGQYYYPFDDLHVTVFDFLQASDCYTKNKQQEDEFCFISREVLRDITLFHLQLKGVVFSSAAGLVKGYDDERLIVFRDRIRKLMRQRGLKNDERYESRSAHVTFCRFASRLHDPAGFVSLIDACTELPLGTEQVSCMQLVEHDWYNSRQTKRVIASFELGSGGVA
jgi:2'-5' RNA ligase